MTTLNIVEIAVGSPLLYLFIAGLSARFFYAISDRWGWEDSVVGGLLWPFVLPVMVGLKCKPVAWLIKLKGFKTKLPKAVARDK